MKIKSSLSLPDNIVVPFARFGGKRPRGVKKIKLKVAQVQTLVYECFASKILADEVDDRAGVRVVLGAPVSRNTCGVGGWLTCMAWPLGDNRKSGSVSPTSAETICSTSTGCPLWPMGICLLWSGRS